MGLFCIMGLNKCYYLDLFCYCRCYLSYFFVIWTPIIQLQYHTFIILYILSHFIFFFNCWIILTMDIRIKSVFICKELHFHFFLNLKKKKKRVELVNWQTDCPGWVSVRNKDSHQPITQSCFFFFEFWRFGFCAAKARAWR